MLNVISLSFTFIERHREYLNSFVIMSDKKRVPERLGWWQNKLASLGIVVKKGNELNDVNLGIWLKI